MLYAGSLFDDKGNLNASLGAHEFKIEVVQAGEDGASASYRFSTRAGLIDIVAGAGGHCGWEGWRERGGSAVASWSARVIAGTSSCARMSASRIDAIPSS
jgi:hypothetical protein